MLFEANQRTFTSYLSFLLSIQLTSKIPTPSPIIVHPKTISKSPFSTLLLAIFPIKVDVFRANMDTHNLYMVR